MALFKKKRTLRIRTYGDPVLAKTSARIANVDDRIKALAKSMVVAMRSAEGVGLAAPQIGENIRLVVLELPPSRDTNRILSKGEMELLPKMPIALVNPEIIPTTNEQVTSEEGCLSVPKLYAQVTRPAKVMLSATNLSGKNLHFECGGFLAKAIQHEVDHLNGVLFPDKLDAVEMKKIAAPLAKLKAANAKSK